MDVSEPDKKILFLSYGKVISEVKEHGLYCRSSSQIY